MKKNFLTAALLRTHASVEFQSTWHCETKAPVPAKKEWKLRPVFLHGRIKRKAHTSVVNKDPQHSSLDIVSAAVPPGGGPAGTQTGRNVKERGRGDGCWKLLGKRIRSVYVGQVARCQLLKCANFLKLQSSKSAMSLSLYLPSSWTAWMAVLC